MKQQIKTVLFRRKRTGRTKYRTRINLLKSGFPRVIIRKSNKHIYVQTAKTAPIGDLIICSSTTKDLAKFGWKGNTSNTCAAYLVGILFSRRLLEKKIKKVIPDIGMHSSVKGGVLYACIKGMIDGGLDVPCSPEVIPDEKRLFGEHISEWGKKASDKFTDYAKKSLAPADIPKHVREVKEKIIK